MMMKKRRQAYADRRKRQESCENMKKIGRWILLLCLLSGCNLQKPYDLQTAEKSEVLIPEDAYHLAGKTLYTLEKSKLEEAETVYYAKDEQALVEIIQYSLDNECYEVAYQSDQKLDMDEVADVLGILNPFDIRLKQNDIAYTNAWGDVLYESHHIRVQGMDERFFEARAEAKKRVDRIVDAQMSTEEKIAAIHDDIITHSVYDDATSSKSNSALYQAAGVLLDGKGVCTGYSRAFMVMAQVADIPAVYVSSAKMNHGWNYVCDQGTWRYIDVTWDDPLPDQKNMVSHTFLSMDTQRFWDEGSHVLSEQEQKKVEDISYRFF